MIGKTVGPYRIVEELGKGGMGVVYKAIHTTLEQQVAIKALSSELSSNQSSRKRFIKEAKIQAKFSHPNVVNIFNYLEDGEDVYIVMEYVDGQTLEQKLKTQGPISENEAISISLPVLDALDFMHSNGVVHRDIKPSNIMITNTGLIKVTDFGIAKVVDEKTQQTKTGMVGSLYYISPEQILGEQTSAATDVYSYGATLFHMITGKALYEGTEYTIMRSHLEGKPVPPWELNDKVSKDLGRIVLKSIQKAPRDRYRSAKEFSQDLQKLESGANISIPLPRIISNNRSIPRVSSFSNKRTIYATMGILLLLSIIAFAYNRKPQLANPSSATANSVTSTDIKEFQTEKLADPDQLEIKPDSPKTVTATNIDNVDTKPADEDERFMLFDENFYNERQAGEIEKQNKKLEEKNRMLEEKLKQEKKLYEAKVREAQRRELERRRKEEQKRREQQKQIEQAKKDRGIKNSYKKVYNPVKKNVFRPIKKGFNKLKNKID